MQKEYELDVDRLGDGRIDVAAGLEGHLVGAVMIALVIAGHLPLEAGVVDRLDGILTGEGDIFHGDVFTLCRPCHSVLVDRRNGDDAGGVDILGHIDLKRVGVGIGIFVAADVEHRILSFIAVDIMHDMARGYIDAVDVYSHVGLKIAPNAPAAEGGDHIYRRGEEIRAAVVFVCIGLAVIVDRFMEIGGGIDVLLTACSPAAFAVNIEIGIIPQVGVISHGDIDPDLVAAVVGCLHRLDQVNLFDALVAVDLELVVIAIEDIRGSALVEFAEAGGYVPVFGVVGGSDADR